MRIDQVALLPAYCAAGTAVLAFLTDLAVPGRVRSVLTVTGTGALGTGAAAVLVGLGPARATFCAGPPGCSYVADRTGALVATLFAALTLAVLALSVGLRSEVPSGEYCFLLACSMTGGVVLGYARDLISLIVALETLTLPLYLLVGLRRRSAAGAQAAVTFFVVSVVSVAVALLGAALLYAVTGAVHFSGIAAALAGHPAALAGHPAAVSLGSPPGALAVRTLPLTGAAVALLLAGLSFKVAAVPFHAWAPAAYDGAPVPVAAYLSTASKVGGVIAIVSVTARALGPSLDVAGPTLALLAVLTMTVGNLAALRQTRMVRLLAWSSIAQAGYILAPLGALALARGRTADAIATAVAATLGYTVFYVILEIGAFAGVVALRGTADGGQIADYRGAARRAPAAAAAFAFALVGLAGLPPGLAGLFAKVVVVRSLLSGGSVWLAVAVALNAVVGLAYYVRVAAVLLSAPAPFSSGTPLSSGTPPAPFPREPSRVRTSAIGPGPWPVLAALGAATLVAIATGFAPQLVLDAVR